MLLFSTLLDINEKISEDDFIRLVIGWNDTAKYEVNKVPGIEWNGERSIRFGSGSLWLEIEEYKKEGIIAVRHEKKSEDGVVWDTDYVMNSKDRRVSVRLDRSYEEDAPSVSSGFATPHFISLLVDKGYLKDDKDLPVQKVPTIIEESNIELLRGLIDHSAGYRLPVIYVSRTRSGEEPVDTGKLASRVKGAAHVLVEADGELDETIADILGGMEVRDGSVAVFYPNETAGYKKFTYRAYRGNDKMFAERIIRDVILYSNAQMTGNLYTWQGVSNALLRDMLDVKGSELLASEKEARELGELVEYADEDNIKLKSQIGTLTHANENLLAENQALRARLGGAEGVPVLVFGEEQEFFRDEIKAIILETLDNVLAQTPEKSRRYDILKDIVDNNPCIHTVDEKSEKIKRAMSGYKNISSAMKQIFAECGIEYSEGSTHPSLTYFGDPRYVVTISKTASDKRAGMNAAMDIIRLML